MKTLILVGMCLLFSIPASAQIQEFPADHLILSTAGTFLSITYLRLSGMPQKQAIAVGTLSIFTLGVFKELAVDPSVGRKDLLQDAGGVLLAGGIHLAWRF